MITSNNRKIPEEEKKRLAILTTNKIRERMRHESPVIVPASKIGGVILQAGKQYERPAAKTQTPVVFDYRKKVAPAAPAPAPVLKTKKDAEDLADAMIPKKKRASRKKAETPDVEPKKAGRKKKT